MRIRTSAACVLLSALLFVNATMSNAHADTAPSFSTTTVGANQAVGEPRVFVDPTSTGPRFFVVGPGIDSNGNVNTFMWWSMDGHKFSGPALTNQAGGGNDSDLAIDANHKVYAADLSDPQGNSGVPISVWSPTTHKFHPVGEVAPGNTSLDRQWIASTSTGHLAVIALDTNSGDEDAWTSSDSGAHFKQTSSPAASSVNVAGPLITGPAPAGGIPPLYFAYLHQNNDATAGVVGGTSDLRVAKSVDGGRTWTTKSVAQNQSSTLFPVVATDRSGGVYAAWSGTDPVSNNSDVIVFAASPHGGSTWNKPVAVSSNAVDALGNAPAAVFPWIVADGAGRVDVTYAIESQPLINSPEGSDDGGPQSTWDLRVAQSLNATATKPTWTSSVAAADFHTGSICSLGTLCVGPQELLGIGNVPTPFDRRDLDFFGSAVDASGKLYVPFCADRPALTGNPNDILFPNIDVRLSDQTGGPTIAAPSAKKKSSPKGRART